MQYDGGDGGGGAERLVVDAAVGLKELGHTVTFYTAHHDRKHCFEETRDGTSSPSSSFISGSLKVLCYGDFLPRHIFGRFVAFFAYLRMVYLAFVVVRAMVMMMMMYRYCTTGYTALKCVNLNTMFVS